MIELKAAERAELANQVMDLEGEVGQFHQVIHADEKIRDDEDAKVDVETATFDKWLAEERAKLDAKEKDFRAAQIGKKQVHETQFAVKKNVQDAKINEKHVQIEECKKKDAVLVLEIVDHREKLELLGHEE